MSTSRAKSLSVAILANVAISGYAAFRGVTKAGKPGLYFGEGRFTMFFSCLQLVAVALLSFAIFRGRKKESGRSGWAAPQNLWVLIGCGFLFLTADEALQIHEGMDQFFHQTLHLAQTNLTDRLDDAIMGAYLVIGIATLWIFREEMKRFRIMLLPLVAGFICGGLSVACDMAGHHEDFFRSLGANHHLASVLVQWADVGDGTFTLIAEGCFVAAFFAGWRQTRAAGGPAEPLPTDGADGSNSIPRPA
jgi:hypothetical protein